MEAKQKQKISFKLFSDPASLLRNVHFRIFLFQSLIVIGIIGFFIFLILNLVRNMEARGIKMGFSFLTEATGFGVLFTLIEYNEFSTVARVYLVGLLNTVLVSVLGIIFATILGFTIGVLRLSDSWLMRKLTTIYIETFRNLPILLQILFWNVIIKGFLPVKSVNISDNVYIGIKGLIYPSLTPTPFAFVWAIVLIALVFACFWLPKWANRRLEKTGKTFPVFYTLCFLVGSGIFLTIALFGLMFGMEPAVQGKFGLEGGTKIVPEIFVLMVSLGVYTATFIAEAVRSGISAVDKGQREAASALGLKPGIVLGKIIMPQAMRVIIPPCINQYLNLTKNSSLALAIGFPDLVAVFAGTALNQIGQAVEMMLMTMFTYLILSILVSVFLNWYNARVKLAER